LFFYTKPGSGYVSERVDSPIWLADYQDLGDRKFLNEWAVHIPGGETKARLVAQELGFQYGGQVCGFKVTKIAVI
jgi:hypothetical protein